MKSKMFWLLVALFSSAVVALGNTREDLPVQEETTRRYQLAAGARVEISYILGQVEIEATQGDIAEVYFVRSARTRADLERFDRIHIEQTSQRLALRGEDSHSDGIEIRHRIKLRLPKDCLLALTEVNGKVSLHGMTGAIRLRDINGGVWIPQCSGVLEMTGINGGITLGLTRLVPNGIYIHDVTGGIELRVAAGLNAQLEIGELDDELLLDTPRATIQRSGKKQQQVQIGSGGPLIRLVDVNGQIKVRDA